MTRLLFVFGTAVGLFLVFFFVGEQTVDAKGAAKHSKSDQNTVKLRWEAHKQKHGHTFKDAAEEQKRFSIFSKRITAIDAHNAKFAEGKETYSLGENWLITLTDEEYSALNGLKPIAENATQNVAAPISRKKRQSYPPSLDYREYGVVTGVKNQGACGDCWAFSASGALEAQIAWYQWVLTSLSEQNLLDCTPQGSGCGGGYQGYAFSYVTSAKGIATQANYPYSSPPVKGTCRYTSSMSVGAFCSSYVRLPAGDENALMDALYYQGPISVAIDAGRPSFSSYSTGVYNDPTCTDGINHGVLLIGYGVDPVGGPYWLVKNSWGTGWGEQGYIRMARGKNICGITKQSLYPVVP